MANMHNPVHPGTILAEWIEGAPQGEVAEHLGMHRTSLSRILNGHAGITADVDVRLSEALGTTAGYWMTLQAQFDLARAQVSKRAKVKPLRTLLLAAAASAPPVPVEVPALIGAKRSVGTKATAAVPSKRAKAKPAQGKSAVAAKRTKTTKVAARKVHA